MTELVPPRQPRPLGSSGITISPLAWGMWRLDGDVRAVRARIDAALDAGITLFDTADIYGYGSPLGFGGAEELLGEAFAEAPGLREQVVLATKGGITPPVPYNSAASYLAQALEASLRRLRTERVELYQIHRRDFLTHPQEVAAALTRMVEAGKVRALGVSNHAPAEVTALKTFLDLPIVSTQPEFSPLRAAPLYDGTLDQAMAEGMAVLAWSPLGGGRLLADGNPAGHLLARQGAAFGADATAAALSWLMVHPARVIPIVGSQQPERIRGAAAALQVEWTREQWYAVLQAGTGEPLP
ncbi:aldo/keto reductase [Erythrobacteraceae bacterium CFH 75059]|uniref:aldo/keto reductase n=1 Tax=Qipengyuania thermophila TaxID=2509361 RepID=UPI00101F45FA|nr:aldo/keto reductase [Qipengyuania thermophila]TCD06662.1 aldo/keto reductase [Erythrobacteraceae bacterium CFH 75059]